jgi:6-phosphofructokinase 1
VIVVAEGAGQDLMDGASPGLDASGNRKLKDVGLFLKDRIVDYFAASALPVGMKYFDPSYIVRGRAPTRTTRCYAISSAQRGARGDGRKRRM